MNKHFSRFLHHILSHSGTKEKSTPSLSLSDLIGESRSNKFASLFNLDYRVKPDNDRKKKDYRVKPDNDSIVNAGRSMVEMLGVLAIIGVLSVGAISGYSKAMMKYKLNKHAEAVNMLINNVLAIKDKLPRDRSDGNGYNYYGTILLKTNSLPDGIKYLSNFRLQDMWFNNLIWVYYYNDYDTGGIGFEINKSASGAEICRNIVFAAKENAANLYALNLGKFNEGETSTYTETLYGDNYCNTNDSCLRNLDLNKVDKTCNVCDKSECTLYTYFK